MFRFLSRELQLIIELFFVNLLFLVKFGNCWPLFQFKLKSLLTILLVFLLNCLSIHLSSFGLFLLDLAYVFIEKTSWNRVGLDMALESFRLRDYFRLGFGQIEWLLNCDLLC